MHYERSKDWRVILFPAWLVVVFSVGVLIAWGLVHWLNPNVAALLSITLMSGYLAYEVFHALEHLPPVKPSHHAPALDLAYAATASTAPSSRADADAQFQYRVSADGLAQGNALLGGLPD